MRIFNVKRHLHEAPLARQPRRHVITHLGLVAFTLLIASTAPAWTGPSNTEVIAEQGDWIIEAEDSVCGVLRERQIHKPAKVDFDRLVDITPEGKKIQRERIDLNSAEGVRLINRAKSRVRDASAIVMKRQGYDSVWKRIRSRRGTHIVDVTAYVEIEIANSPRASAPIGL